MATYALPAQKVRFSISSESITTDEAVEVALELSEVSGNIPMPQWPQVKGLANGGNRTNQSWVNGRASISFAHTYVPQAPGKFTIPSFTYAIYGKTFQSPEFVITVKKGSGKRPNPPSSQQFSSNPFDAFFGDPFSSRSKEPLKFQETKADYFLSINLNKNTCFVGEQIRGDVVLYINERDYGKINLDGRDIVDMQQKIKNNGFWQEIIEFDEVPMERVVVNNKRYIAYKLYQTILFPIKSGEIAFKGIDLNAKKLYVATNASIMDAFRGANQKYEPIKIKAQERILNVLPLPTTALPEANMVGKFRMRAKLSDSVATTGDNLELQITVEGNGNIAMMEFPKPTFPSSFRDDGNSSDYKNKVSESGFYGEKTFKYFLVPTRPGQYDLGPIKFYHFNPGTKSYDSLVVPNLPVKVSGEDLTDKLLKDKELDRFYEQGFSQSSTRLIGDSWPVWPFWTLGVSTLVFAGVWGGIRRRRNQPEKSDQR